MVVSILLLTLAVSVDGFGVGVMYGLRRIKVPLTSIGIITICSGTVIWVSMQMGLYLSRYVAIDAARRVGGLLLILIGCWTLFKVFTSMGISDHVKVESSMGAIAPQSSPDVLGMLKEPNKADLDHSGNISAYEALWLGVALSLDAFGAGLGAALLGMSPWLTSVLIACGSGLFVTLGLKIGYRFATWIWLRKMTFLPGCLLLLTGILKLFLG